MLRIVVVDDNREDLILAERVLELCKVQNPISLLPGGDSCIAYLQDLQTRQRGDGEKALILLDLVMSPTSGLSVLTWWQNSNARLFSAIVMVSGLTDVKMIDQGYKLGAKTYLLKPLKVDDFLQLLSHLKQSVKVEQKPGGYLVEWVEQTFETAGSANGSRPKTVSLSA